MIRVNFLKVLAWTSVKLWAEVLSSFLVISDVLSMIQIETYVKKQKRVVKIEGVKCI